MPGEEQEAPEEEEEEESPGGATRREESPGEVAFGRRRGQIALALQRLERCSTKADAWAAELLDAHGYSHPLRMAILEYGLRATIKIMAYDELMSATTSRSYARGPGFLRDRDKEEEDLRDLLAFVTYMETELAIYQQEVEETRSKISKKRRAEHAFCGDGRRIEMTIEGEADFWGEYSSADSEEQDVDGCEMPPPEETPIAGEDDFWAGYSSGPNTEGADSEEQDVDGCEMLPSDLLCRPCFS